MFHQCAFPSTVLADNRNTFTRWMSKETPLELRCIRVSVKEVLAEINGSLAGYFDVIRLVMTGENL